MNEQSKYTENVFVAIRKIKKPYPIHIDIRENEVGLVFVVYEQEVMSLPEKGQRQILEYLQMVNETVQKFGIKSMVAGVKGAPPI